jgi:hypothetical protein
MNNMKTSFNKTVDIYRQQWYIRFLFKSFTWKYISCWWQGPGWLNELVRLPSNSYKPITNTAWVRAPLCKLQKRCTRLAAASDKEYQLLAHGRWFSPGTPASFSTKTGPHDIVEILLKVALSTINQIKSNIIVLMAAVVSVVCLLLKCEYWHNIYIYNWFEIFRYMVKYQQNEMLTRKVYLWIENARILCLFCNVKKPLNNCQIVYKTQNKLRSIVFCWCPMWRSH